MTYDTALRGLQHPSGGDLESPFLLDALNSSRDVQSHELESASFTRETPELNVVAWKKRVVPGKRQFPRGFRLGILTRGRVRLPIERARWLLDLFKGQLWVARLTADPAKLLREVDISVELFRVLDTSLTPVQQRQSLDAYLKLRHEQHLKDTPFYLAYAEADSQKAFIEGKLGLSLDSLYARARISKPGAVRSKKYMLLVYASFPKSLASIMAAPVPAPSVPKPTVRPQRLPALRAGTKGCFNVREQAPSGKVFGELRAFPSPIWIVGKQLIGKDRWYKIRVDPELELSTGGPCGSLKNKTVRLPVGTTAWIQGYKWVPADENFWGFKTEAQLEQTGVDRVIAPWAYFIAQIEDFERAHAGLSLTRKITKLRRMAHNGALPFDAVVGRKKNPDDLFLEQRSFVPDDWELLLDYQLVRAPDGELVDIYHLIVGLDVLTNRIDSHSFATMSIGANYSAATWAGDLGAAVADAMLEKDKWWHALNPKASETERVRHYYVTRAPESDLLGDIDAWGINALRTSESDSLAGLLRKYYEDLEEGALTTLTRQRADALGLFLHDYGFKFDAYADEVRGTLAKQPRSMDRIRWHIEAFGRVWHFKSKPFEREHSNSSILSTVTNTFLIWLEDKATEHGVVI